MPNLVLGLGNDLLGDDGVGLVVARRVRALSIPDTDVVESGEAGLALLELLAGYDSAVIVDAIQTGAAPGAIHRLGRENFDRIIAPSAHYAGLPEVFGLADQLGVDMPKQISVIAIEVEDPFSFSESLTPHVARAVPAAVDAVVEVLQASISISTR